MAQDTGAAQAQAAGAAQPQEGASQVQETDAQKAQAAGADSESGTVDIRVLQRELSEVRTEAAKYRAQARALEETQRQADEAKLSEGERQAKRAQELEDENATLKRELHVERVQSRVLSAATRLGFADPVDAYRLLDGLDDEEQLKNVDKLLADLLKTKPYLASAGVRATGSAEGGVRGTNGPGANTTQDMNALIRQAAGRT